MPSGREAQGTCPSHNGWFEGLCCLSHRLEDVYENQMLVGEGEGRPASHPEEVLDGVFHPSLLWSEIDPEKKNWGDPGSLEQKRAHGLVL